MREEPQNVTRFTMENPPPIQLKIYMKLDLLFYIFQFKINEWTFVNFIIYIALRARGLLNILALRRCSGASRSYYH